MVVCMLCLFALAAWTLPAHALDATGEPAKTAVIYVAPNGDDANPGSLAQPLASMAGARDRIRAWRASGSGFPSGGVRVQFRGGTYQVRSAIEFDASDSGTEGSPIVYEAYPDETPVFSGGVVIAGSDLKPIADRNVLARLPNSDAQNKVLACPLFRYGIGAYDLDMNQAYWARGELQPGQTENRSADAPRRMQVFIGDEALHLARYPNKVAGPFVDNPYDAYLSIAEIVGEPDRNGLSTSFRVDDQRIQNWTSFTDIAIFGPFGASKAVDRIVAQSIDPVAMTVSLEPLPGRGVKVGGRYAFENVFEELDAPGEYFIDKYSGLLYLYPSVDMRQAVVKISMLDEDYLIDVVGASQLTFSGLHFELTKGSIFRFKGGEAYTVQNCTLKNIGGVGIRMGEKSALNGANQRITGNRFLNTGQAAIVLYAGQNAGRTPGNVTIENNVVKHSGLLGSVGQSGLVLEGVGIAVQNNAFYFCRGQAIVGSIVDSRIERNEFCDSPCEGAGVFAGDLAASGNASDTIDAIATVNLNLMSANDRIAIRDNYFHDLTSMPIRYGTGSPYFDDSILKQSQPVFAEGESVSMDSIGVQGPSPQSATPLKRGWNLVDVGWVYCVGDDAALHKGWLAIDGVWRYLDRESGVMRTGWLTEGDRWYYLQPNGAMTKGWAQIDGAYRFFDGAGVMQSGWIRWKGALYYLEPGSGALIQKQ